MQSEGGQSSKTQASGGGAVKKKRSNGGSKPKKEQNSSTPDSKPFKSKGGSRNTPDSQFSIETPKHQRRRRGGNSENGSDGYSDFSAKMNSSDNMRKQKVNTSAGNAAEAAYSPGVSARQDEMLRSKTPDVKKKNKPSRNVRKSNPLKQQFEPYIPLFQVQQGLKRGEFIEGALRINPRNYEDAYVSSPDGKMDIYIGGMHARNRALNGDLVVVQINPKQEWKVLCDAIKDHQEKSGDIVDTVCQPIPSPPCKVHTPDKLIRRPASSNSWGSSSAERPPDTLEILGFDRIARQFQELAIADGKKKKKSGKVAANFDGENSNSGATPCSQESLDECVGKYSIPGENLQEGGSNVPDMVGSVLRNEDCAETSSYPVCDMNNIGTFKLKENHSMGSQAWEMDDASVNIIVSPEQLLCSNGDSIVNVSNTWNDYDSESSDVPGMCVPPGDLSGEEFTDSVSIGSSRSHSLDQIIEDAEFLASQQDADNNNVEFSENYVYDNLNNSNLIINNTASLRNTVEINWERPTELECKIQHGRALTTMPCIEVDLDDAVVCTTMPEVLSKDHSSSDENINCNVVKPMKVSEFHGSIVEQSTAVKSGKKKRVRSKRKKKNGKSSDGFKADDGWKENNSDIKNIPSNNLNRQPNQVAIDSICNDFLKLTVTELLEYPEGAKFVQKTGKVVHILERKHTRIAAGHLKLCPDKNPNWAFFSPNDSRVPRAMVPMSDCPSNFFNRPQDYAKVLFLVEIVDWNETAAFATGRLLNIIGKMGEIDTETYGILTENGVDFDEFSKDVLNCLPQEENWKVPEDEITKRRDFRKECVFTIDPATARDMDDAVSCKKLKNGNYEVGVHIADVTYFVQEGTELDKVAQNRSTSVYLVQKVIPMLPRLLCDNLCSLNPGKDRLTFSVVWEMTPDGQIQEQWIGRSVINSCVKLSYEHAQSMIETTGYAFEMRAFPEMYGQFQLKNIVDRVRQLNAIALKLRERRFDSGALKLDHVKLQFALDGCSGMPTGFKVYEQKDSNRLIEEYMLLANMCVALKIYKAFPHLAMLRKHPPPKDNVMDDVVSMCEAMGIILDASSSGSLQSSIAKYHGEDSVSQARVMLLMNLCARPMNCALYFCTGGVEDVDTFRHYALNVPFYTHFTSPIRRFPDVVVHRLLGAALGYHRPPKMTPQEVQKCANHCNDKKYNAKRVSDLSDEMFLAAFLREVGSVTAKGMVMGVMDHSFDCLILEMGVVKRVYCNQLPLLDKKFKRSHGVSTLNIFWKDDVVKTGIEQVIVIFAMVDVMLTVEQGALQIKAVLIKPE